MTSAKIGRPSKYTSDRVARILEYLKAGNTRKAAATASGISVETFCQWLHTYPDFSEQVTCAEGEAETTAVGTILTAALKGQWGAAAFWLERRRHDDWGKKDRIELVRSVEQMAKDNGIDKDAAVTQAELYLLELRSQARK